MLCSSSMELVSDSSSHCISGQDSSVGRAVYLHARGSGFNTC